MRKLGVNFQLRVITRVASSALLAAGVATLMFASTSAQAAEKKSAKGTATVSKTLEERILAAMPGATIDVGDYDLDSPTNVAWTRTGEAGPPLLFSDDPEYLRLPECMAIREEVGPGPLKLYVYHVNGTTDTVKRISAVVENITSDPLTVTFLRRAFVKPSTDYHAIGKAGLLGYLSGGEKLPPLVVEPGKFAALDPAMEATKVKFDDLVHGFYELEFSGRARVSVLQTDLAFPSAVAAARIEKILPPKSKSGAGRGYFPITTFDIETAKDVVIDTKNGAQQIVVADGKTDPWVKGRPEDGATTDPTNKGNYGVMYKMKLKRTSSDGRGLALLMWNARAGGQWCGGMAAAVDVSAGKFPAGVREVPSDRVALKTRQEASVVQIFPPTKPGETDTIEIVYSPPGASCLPTPLVFVPVDWAKE